MTKTRVVVTILEPTPQSQFPPTIHYTCIETLEGLRCSEILESIQNTQSWCEMLELGVKIVTTRYSKARVW